MMTQEEKRAAYYKTPQRLHVYESSVKAKQIVQKSITIDTLFSGVVPIQWSTPQAPEFTGLTWFVRKYGEITSAFHGGTYIGYRTFLQLIPEHNFAVIVLTNSDRGVEAYTAVADAMVKAFTKLEPHTEVASGVDPSVLDPFIGVFKGTFQDFEITKNGGKYQLLQDSKLTKPGADPAPANIANTKEGWFIVTEGPNKGALGELLKDPSGELNYLRFNHRIFIRSNAVPGS